jgi:peptide deformylase
MTEEKETIKFITRSGIPLPEITPEVFDIVTYREALGEALSHMVTTEITKELAAQENFRKTVAYMCCTMYNPKRPGIGIASNQLGYTYNMCVIDTDWVNTEKHSPRVMLNPRIIEVSDEKVPSQEGCLSVPLGYNAEIPRHKSVTIEYEDLDFYTMKWEADGLAAMCIQHELDHLKGVLFIDHLSRLKRDMFDRKLTKLIRINKKENERKLRQLKEAINKNVMIKKWTKKNETIDTKNAQQG